MEFPKDLYYALSSPSLDAEFDAAIKYLRNEISNVQDELDVSRRRLRNAKPRVARKAVAALEQRLKELAVFASLAVFEKMCRKELIV